jgi:protein-S-isoprenylcysteine O-methyltransferase Ste14
MALIYTLGFSLFWSFPAGYATGETAWLFVSSLIAGTHALSLRESTLFVTVFALVAGIKGTALRVWATAHLGSETMRGSEMQAGQVVASGPYRHLRNPLYLGSWLVSLPIVLLMPVAGAVFALAAITFFLLRLIAGEEAHLGEKLGERYDAYRERVPRIVPKAFPEATDSGARAQWLQAVVAEIFPVGFTICFAVFAWKYNAQLLTRCLLVCFGVSLVVRSLTLSRRA